jgi:hypothetical protein
MKNYVLPLVGFGALLVAGCQNYGTKPAFSNDKIFTASVESYCASVGKTPADYRMVAVSDDALPVQLDELPAGTEAIVAVDESAYTVAGKPGVRVVKTIRGTALIPKK